MPALMLVAALATGCGSTRDLPASQARTQERATQVALSMVGKPYHYGGNSPQAGFDCSGLVQYSYGRAGVQLPHGTSHLRRASRSISKGNLRRGDLLFFDQEGKKTSHVAIYIGDDRFVHAPSSGKSVHVTNFSAYWDRHFNEARRLDVD
jgi:cell wall-associated NlpC family hydrolase